MAFTPEEEETLRVLIQNSDALNTLAKSEDNIMEALGTDKISLSELPAGVSLNDSDILLLRTGSLDQSVMLSQIRDYILSNIGVMIGATQTSSGKSGFVTTPPAGSQNKALFGDGNWKELLPSGIISCYAGSVCPEGWLFCHGTELLRSEYPSLFNAIGTTYGSGDGSTTFNIPNIKGRYIKGVDESNYLGKAIPPGLPDINFQYEWGYSGRWDNGGFATGALEAYPTGRNGAGDHSSVAVGLKFSASKSNPIYGASNTVDVNGIALNYIIKV